MKKIIIALFCFSVTQAIGSGEGGGWDYASMSRKSCSYTSYVHYPHDYHEDFDGYKQPGLWHKDQRLSVVDLAEGMDALVEGLKSLGTSLWNFITQ